MSAAVGWKVCQSQFLTEKAFCISDPSLTSQQARLTHLTSLVSSLGQLSSQKIMRVEKNNRFLCTLEFSRGLSDVDRFTTHTL